MKSILLFVLLLVLVSGASAAEPVQIRISVDYPEPPVPEIQFALFSAELAGGTKKQVTPWSTNAFATISATNQSAFFSMAVSNSLTGELGFSNERWVPLRIRTDLPLKIAKQP